MAKFVARVVLMMTMKVLVEGIDVVIKNGSCVNGTLCVCSLSVLDPNSSANGLKWVALRNQENISLPYEAKGSENGTMQCLSVPIEEVVSEHNLSSPFTIFAEHYYEESSKQDKSDSITINCSEGNTWDPTEKVLVIVLSSLGAIVIFLFIVGIAIVVGCHIKKRCKRQGRGPPPQNIRMDAIPGSQAESPTSSLEGPTSSLEGPTSSLEGPTSSLEGPTSFLEAAATIEDKAVPCAEMGRVSEECVESLSFSYPSNKDHEELRGVLNVNQRNTEEVVAMESSKSQSVAGGTCLEPESEERSPGWGVKKKDQMFPHSVFQRSFIEETFSNGRDQEGTLKPFLSELQELYTGTYDP